MSCKALTAENVVVKCRNGNPCFEHVVHVGDVLPYGEGDAEVLNIRVDGLKVRFLGRMNSKKRRNKTGEVWRFKKRNVCVMPLPKRFDSVDEWVDSLK